jgi:GNAT superfamily N-acetyltransferase
MTIADPRLARPEEAAAIRTLVRDAYAHYVPRIGREPAPMTDDYPARVAAGQAWVLLIDGAIAGVLVLEDQADALLIENIAVAAPYRGRSVGSSLMAFAERVARERGLGVLRLYTHERMVENIAIYGHLGYAETHRVQEKGYARVYMEKPLA